MAADLVISLIGEDLRTSCFRDPLFRDELPAVPLPLLQIKQTQLCNCLLYTSDAADE